MTTDIDDPQFSLYVRMAKIFTIKLDSEKDRVISSKWVKKIESTADPGAQKTKKHAIELLIMSLMRKRLVGPFETAPEDDKELASYSWSSLQPNDIAKLILEKEFEKIGEPPIQIEVSGDLREYLAYQPIPSFGTHFYYAFSPERIKKWGNLDKEIIPKGLLDITVMSSPQVDAKKKKKGNKDQSQDQSEFLDKTILEKSGKFKEKFISEHPHVEKVMSSKPLEQGIVSGILRDDDLDPLFCGERSPDNREGQVEKVTMSKNKEKVIVDQKTKRSEKKEAAALNNLEQLDAAKKEAEKKREEILSTMPASLQKCIEKEYPELRGPGEKCQPIRSPKASGASFGGQGTPKQGRREDLKFTSPRKHASATFVPSPLQKKPNTPLAQNKSAQRGSVSCSRNEKNGMEPEQNRVVAEENICIYSPKAKNTSLGPVGTAKQVRPVSCSPNEEDGMQKVMQRRSEAVRAAAKQVREAETPNLPDKYNYKPKELTEEQERAKKARENLRYQMSRHRMKPRPGDLVTPLHEVDVQHFSKYSLRRKVWGSDSDEDKDDYFEVSPKTTQLTERLKAKVTHQPQKQDFVPAYLQAQRIPCTVDEDTLESEEPEADSEGSEAGWDTFEESYISEPSEPSQPRFTRKKTQFAMGCEAMKDYFERTWRECPHEDRPTQQNLVVRLTHLRNQQGAALPLGNEEVGIVPEDIAFGSFVNEELPDENC